MASRMESHNGIGVVDLLDLTWSAGGGEFMSVEVLAVSRLSRRLTGVSQTPCPLSL